MNSTRSEGTDAVASHQLLVSRSPDEFADAANRWVRNALGAGDVVACNLGPASRHLLRARLGEAAALVGFGDGDGLYRRPPSVFAHYARFVAGQAAAGRGVSVVGEMDLRGTEPATRREWARYEAAVTAAFGRQPVRFLCHYAADTLADGQRAQLDATHPQLWTAEGVVDNPAFRDPWTFAAELDVEPLPAPVQLVGRAVVTATSLSLVRVLVAREASRLGADEGAVDAAVIAVSEAAANAVWHGGGGALRLWRAGGQLVCEVTNQAGHIDQPLAGYQLRGAAAGHGLWMIRQLAHRMEIRGGTIRLHLAARPSGAAGALRAVP